MRPVFDFGISQEDADVEISCLDISEGDSLLCIASGGEVPLNILANRTANVRAVDISLSQVYLSRLKWISSLTFDPQEGASFLGFLKADGRFRARCLQRAAEFMGDGERDFWRSHIDLIEQGVIHTARFERYLSRFRNVALHLLGRAKLLKLMELDSVEEQCRFFDSHFHVTLLRKLFGVVFRPQRYRNGAIAEQGFHNAGAGSPAEFFFSRFRAFCTATPARRNTYLQFYLFNRLLFPEALPDFLQEQGIDRIRRSRDRIEFAHLSYRDVLRQAPAGEYNKFHVSNIGDWMSGSDFEDLLEAIDSKARRPYRILSRYLHSGPSVPRSLQKKMAVEVGGDGTPAANDRFPFYNIVPISSM